MVKEILLLVLSSAAVATQTPQHLPVSGATLTEPLKAPVTHEVVKVDQQSGSDACAKLASSFAVLGSGSGTIDARGLTGAQVCASNPFEYADYSAALILLARMNLTSTYIGAWKIPANTHIIGSGYENTILQFRPMSNIDVAVQVSGSNVELEGVKWLGGPTIGRLIDARGYTFTRIHHDYFSGAGHLPGSSANAAIALGGTNGADQWVTDNIITNIGICGKVNVGSFDVFSDYSASLGRRIHVDRNLIFSSCTNTSIGLNDVQDSDIDDNRIDQNDQIRSDTNTSGGYGAMIYASRGTPIRNDVSRNEIRNTAGSAIYLQTCNYCTAHGNRLHNVGQQEAATSLPVAGIATNNGTAGSITGNLIMRSGQDGISEEAASLAQGPETANNSIRGVSRFCATLANIAYSSFHDNVLAACANNGISVPSGTSLSHVRISGNTLSGLSRSGIDIAAAVDTQLTGNSITWPATRYAIILEKGPSSNVAISGNDLNGSGFGIDAGGISAGCIISRNIIKGASDGIVVDRGAVNCQIDGNVLYQTAVGIVTTRGTKSNVTNNRLNHWTTAILIGATDQRDANQLTPGGILSGTAILATGTKIVSSTEIQTGDRVYLSDCGARGTPGTLSLGTVVEGTSFVINSSSDKDSSTVCWRISH